MRFSLSIPAPDETRFALDAFADTVGQWVRFRAPGLEFPARVVSAKVLNGGPGVIVTLEVVDWPWPPEYLVTIAGEEE